jgi:hypothetical protein
MGWLLMVAFGWVVLFGVSLFAPQLLAVQWQFGGTLTAITAVASTLGLLGAGSPSSGAGEGPQRPTWYRAALARVPGLAAGMALLGLFILMSVGLELLLRAVTGQVGEPPSGPFRELSHDGAMTARLFCLLLLTTIAFGKRINSNRLSLHAVYRDRLIRAFLGASNADRRADPFTGFAPEDNLPMHHLRRHRAFTEQELSGSVAGVPRVVGVAQLLHDRPRPVLQYMWEAAAPYLGPINTERLRAAHDGGAMREHAVAEAVEKALNVALSDPQLVWRSRFKEAAEREAPGCEAINQAFKRLEHDECPELLNRLILEEELYLELPEGPRPGAAGDGRMRRVHLLRPQAGEASVPRPLHVVNVALNLVDGRRLAWQQRKATSFTVSPLHSGYSEGYRPSVEYGGAITLGTAVTISGAAVSPNMGYHSSPVVTFLMTLFNVRLGWWLGNPARVAPGLWRRLARRAGFTVSRGAAAAPSYELSGPDHSVRPLLDEALGRTSELSQYVYLSDGGHFDNLGIYEMVRRRCRYIVVSDASCDPECTFEDLANAIRKVQIDMGVPISIKEILRPPGPDGAHRGRSCAVGEIDYAAVDGPDAEAGTLIYLKPARREAAPVDLYSHGRTSRDFPHEPTADQWFSESQFESYRKLGYVTVESVCAGHERGGAAVTSLAEFVAAARRQATPGPRRGPRHGTGDVEGPRAA